MARLPVSRTRRGWWPRLDTWDWQPTNPGASMIPRTTILRVVRPTDRLEAIAEMYVRGLGVTVHAQFTDHEGFYGRILGHADEAYHLEFTCRRGHPVTDAPSKDHLLVFYVAVAG